MGIAKHWLGCSMAKYVGYAFATASAAARVTRQAARIFLLMRAGYGGSERLKIQLSQRQLSAGGRAVAC